MKLEQQVCSLELSKKLKELGVKQESIFKYCGGHYMYNEADEERFEECPNTDLLDTSDEFCHTAGLTTEFTVSAFTVAELGELLDRYLREDLLQAYGHVFGVIDNRFITPLGLITCLTKPNVCAKMLIYLLENKLTNPRRV